MSPDDRSRTRLAVPAGVGLFAAADIEAGQARLAGVIRELLQLGAPATLEDPVDDDALLDPGYFVCFATADPPYGPPEVAERARRRTVLRGTRTRLEAADPSGAWPVLAAWGESIDWERSSASEVALRDPLERAFTVLGQVQPRLAKAIRSTTRVVVGFAGDQPDSFATRSAHGAVFLNWRPGDGLGFALEELAHQGGHVLLTTMLFGVEGACFVVAPESRLDAGHPDPEDRTVLVVLHAVFTEALMVATLWGCLSSPGLTALERHEVHGRLAYILHRFRFDLVDLLSAAVLSEQGRDLVDRCRHVYDLAVEQWAVPAPPLDLSGQPYAFSRQRFLQANPRPADRFDAGAAPIL